MSSQPIPDTANLSSSPSNSTVLPLTPTRDPTTTTTPHWIGPAAPSLPNHPGSPIMKTKVRLSYSNHGLQPPVFVVTSASDPQWQPVEMQTAQKGDGQFEFYKDFEVEEGPYQYKFRLGSGDWWVLDETKQSVDDGLGNRNNVVVVQAPRSDSPTNHKTEVLDTSLPKQDTGVDVDDDPIPISTDNEDEPEEANDHTPPLFRHESLDQVTIEAADDDDDDEPSHYYDNEHIEQTNAENDNGAPLFRHESFSPQLSQEAPLFRHESNMLESWQTDIDDSPRKGGRSNTSHLVPETEGVTEKFPTDPVLIMDHIRRSTMRLPEDETIVDGTPPSPTLLSRSNSNEERSLDRSTSTASHLDSIHEAEEEISHADDADRSAVGPQSKHHHHNGHKYNTSHLGPIELLTPPMTPDMGQDVTNDAQFERFEAESEPVVPHDVRTGSDEKEIKIYNPESDNLWQSRREAGFLAFIKAFIFSISSWFTGLLWSPGGKATGVIAIAVGVAAAVWRFRDLREAAQESMA